MKKQQICPCGSLLTYGECCGLYIEGKKSPPTAVALMRSRYTAYVLRDEEYLVKTWLPDNRPEPGAHNPDLHWVSLEVLGVTAGGEGDKEGQVEFVANYKLDGRYEQLHELSSFKRYRNRWYYVDGEDGAPMPVVSNTKPGRNDPCLCGSNKKYKRCCGA